MQSIESLLGYSFRDKRLLTQALTHSSAVSEGRSDGPDYQRLEFLGDAVLQLVVSQVLMSRYPQRSEGDLSFIRSEIVRKETVADRGEKIGILDHVITGASLASAENAAFRTLAAETVEALLGAVFLDGGWDAARGVTILVLGDLPNPGDGLKGAKSHLQEIIQSRFDGDVPTYTVEEVNRGVPENRFRAAVFHAKRLLGTGLGRSKKRAEESAAEKALRKLKKP
ncbi:MAG TPA: ribonuclease III [Proteobacteria bacterium]|nr:ribonuclease 3 [bacterium BMS3Abin14]HDL53024.1 ribonuclease III [Pseudomonadota bacterium]